MLKRTQLMDMLKMQSDMNAKVNPEWLAAGYPFMRAVVIEGGEAMDHAGWKWWKAQTRDVEQLQMELVDVWHFALSETLKFTQGDLNYAATLIMDELADRNGYIDFDLVRYYLEEMDDLHRLELMIGLATVRRFEVELFETLLADAGMGWGDLYRNYVGKNVLNFFRQDNGYKEGSYVKIWDGREDNEHLTEILLIEHHSNGGADDGNLRNRVYAALESRYELLCAPAA